MTVRASDAVAGGGGSPSGPPLCRRGLLAAPREPAHPAREVALVPSLVELRRTAAGLSVLELPKLPLETRQHPSPGSRDRREHLVRATAMALGHMGDRDDS